jgi:hypothetical protein
VAALRTQSCTHPGTRDHGHPSRRYMDARAGRLSRSEAVFIAEGVLRALHTVHGIGMVHLAICPSTVARAWDGAWRLIDLHLLRTPGDDAATALFPLCRRRQRCPPELLAVVEEGAGGRTRRTLPVVGD